MSGGDIERLREVFPDVPVYDDILDPDALDEGMRLRVVGPDGTEYVREIVSVVEKPKGTFTVTHKDPPS